MDKEYYIIVCEDPHRQEFRYDNFLKAVEGLSTAYGFREFKKVVETDLSHLVPYINEINRGMNSG